MYGRGHQPGRVTNQVGKFAKVFRRLAQMATKAFQYKIARWLFAKPPLSHAA